MNWQKREKICSWKLMMVKFKKIVLSSILFTFMGVSNSQTMVFDVASKNHQLTTVSDDNDNEKEKNIRLEGVRQDDGTVIFQQAEGDEDDDVLFTKNDDGSVVDQWGNIIEEARDRVDPFYRAVVTQNNAQIKNLLDGGQNPNKVFEDGNTALHLAANYKNDEMVSLLLAKNASLTITNKNKATAMHHICGYGTKNMLAMAKVSLGNEFVKSLNSSGAYGRNCLHYALLDSQDVGVIKDLLSSGMNLEHISSEGQTPSHYAVMMNEWQSLKAIVEYDVKLINVKAQNTLDEKTPEDLMMERMPILNLLEFLRYFNDNNQDLLNDRFNRANL